MTTTSFFVGGLSPITEDVHLVEYFSRFGNVLDARVAVDHTTGRKKGFGFVTVYGGDPCRILSQCHTLGGRLVDLSLFLPNVERTAVVMNIDDDRIINPNDLWGFFGFYGRVSDITRHPDPFTGFLHMTHCYVTFEDAAAYGRIVNRYHHFCGVRLLARPARDRNGGQQAAPPPTPLDDESRVYSMFGH